MIATIDLAEIALFGGAMAVAGAIAGFLAGLFGIGGGAILVPVFYQVLVFLGVDETIRMHICIGTSLAIIVPTSLRSFQSHYRRGAVDMDLLKSWLVPVPLGTVLASLLAASVTSGVLRAMFAVIAVIVALKLIFARTSWTLAADIPGNPVRAVIGVLTGFLSTLMGIGGGVMTNTFMTLFGRPMTQAVATSSGVGVLISLPAMIGFIWAGWGSSGLPPLSTGFVNWIGVLLVIPITMVTAPLGAGFAHRLERRQLEMAFGVFLLIIAARFSYSFL